MPIYDFLNESSFQNFPLTEGNNDLSGLAYNRKWLLDMCLTFGIVSGHDGLMPVILDEIVSDGTNVTFRFTCSSLSMAFKCQCPANATFGYTVVANPVDTDGTSLGSEYGFGFLQVGDLSQFASVVHTWTGGSGTVDSTCVESLFNHQVFTINIANKPTTIITDQDCASSTTPVEYDTESLVVVDVALTGDVKLDGGYYSNLSVDDQNSIVTVGIPETAAQSDDLPCDPSTKVVYPLGYTPPVQASCSELIFTINGIGPNQNNVFTFQDSPGISFSAIPDSNALQMLINQNLLFKNFVTDVPCPSSSSTVPSSISTLSPNDVSGLISWVDASTIAGANGSVVSTLVDISGYGVNFITAAGSLLLATASPTYGKPGVTFNGSTQLKTATVLSGTTSSAATVLLVYAPAGVTNSVTFSTTGDDTSTANQFMLKGPYGDNNFYFDHGDSSSEIAAAAGVTANQPIVLAIRVLYDPTHGSYTDITKDGVLLNSQTSASPLNWTGKQLFLSGLPDGTLKQAMCLNELCIYNRKVSDTELSGLIAGLSAKWGFP